jgi:Domain of unknown function (DUF4170)
MPQRYWVVGGEYTDTDFTALVDGQDEERHGPYDELETARKEWAGLSMAKVDNAMVRYRIEHGGETEYWVIGGRYQTTEFQAIADGSTEERHGPYADYDEAMKEWQARSMSLIDDAHVRYRIEQA